MRVRGDHIILNSGRRFYAFGGVLGLGENVAHVTYGWDGHIEEDIAESSLTAQERQDIGTAMIERWTRWMNR